MQIDIIGGVSETSSQINVLISTLGRLESTMARSIYGLSNLSKGFNGLSTSLKLLNSVDMGSINQKLGQLNLTSNIDSQTQGFVTGAKQFRSAVNSLDKTADKFPIMSAKIQALDIASLKMKFEEISSAIIPFNQAMNTASQNLSGFVKLANSLPTSVNKTVTSLNKINGGGGSKKSSTAFFGFGNTLLKLGSITYLGRQLGNFLGNAIQRSNEYTENMNLFTVALGGYTDKAMKFVEQLGTLGIDPAESTRMMGVFYQVSNALGLSSEKAYVLSEQFTKLTYDLASFFNIDTATAFAKMKAGLVGETEPLRELGLVITENNLAETARRLGITKSIRTMVEQEKIQLRFITLMEQSKNAMNDLERTIMSPANGLRLLKAQFNILTREIGNAFIPVLLKAMPYMIAFTKVLGNLARAFASLMGYELPEFDTASVGSSAIADNLSDAQDSAKQIQKSLAGFDEVNLINQNSSGGSSGVGSGGLLDLDLEQYGYELMFEDIETRVDELVPDMEKLAEAIGKVVLAIAGLKLITTIWGGFEVGSKIIGTLVDWVGKFVGGFKGVEGTTGIIAKLGGAFKSLLTFIGGLSAPVLALVAIIASIGASFLYVYNTSEEFRKKVQDVFAWFGDFTKNTFGYVKDQFKGLWDAMKELWDTLFSGIIKPVGGAIINYLAEIGFVLFKNFTEIAGIVTNTLGMVFGGFLQTLKGIIQMITGLLQGFMTGDWSKLWEGLGNVVEGLSAIVAGILVGIMNGMILLVNNGIKYINSIKVPDWVPLIGGKSLNISTLDYIQSPSFGQDKFPQGTGNYVTQPPIQTSVVIDGREVAKAVHNYDSTSANRGVSYTQNW